MTLVDQEEAAPFPLHKAAFTGDLEELQALVEEEKNSNEKFPIYNKPHNTPIHAAARKGRTEVATWILKKYPRVNPYAMNEHGETFMHVAATYDYLDTLQATADIMERLERETPERALAYAKDKLGNTILHRAVLRKHVHVTEWIVATYAENMWDMKNNDGATALHLAAGTGALDCVKLLIENSKELSAVIDHTGATPLFYAACYGKLDCLMYLEEHGLASISSTNGKGENTLHTAAQGGHLSTVAYLESKLGDGCWLQQTQQGATPIHFAAATNQYKVIEHFLQNSDAPRCVNITDRRKNTAGHVAAQVDHLESFRLLVQNGASLTKRNKEGKTPRQIGLKKPKIGPFLMSLDKSKSKKKSSVKAETVNEDPNSGYAYAEPTGSEAQQSLRQRSAVVTNRQIAEIVEIQSSPEPEPEPDNWRLQSEGEQVTPPPQRQVDVDDEELSRASDTEDYLEEHGARYPASEENDVHSHLSSEIDAGIVPLPIARSISTASTESRTVEVQTHLAGVDLRIWMEPPETEWTSDQAEEYQNTAPVFQEAEQSEPRLEETVPQMVQEEQRFSANFYESLDEVYENANADDQIYQNTETKHIILNSHAPYATVDRTSKVDEVSIEPERSITPYENEPGEDFGLQVTDEDIEDEYNKQQQDWRANMFTAIADASDDDNMAAKEMSIQVDESELSPRIKQPQPHWKQQTAQNAALMASIKRAQQERQNARKTEPDYSDTSNVRPTTSKYSRKPQKLHSPPPSQRKPSPPVTQTPQDRIAAYHNPQQRLEPSKPTVEPVNQGEEVPNEIDDNPTDVRKTMELWREMDRRESLRHQMESINAAHFAAKPVDRNDVLPETEPETPLQNIDENDENEYETTDNDTGEPEYAEPAQKRDPEPEWMPPSRRFQKEVIPNVNSYENENHAPQQQKPTKRGSVPSTKPKQQSPQPMVQQQREPQPEWKLPAQPKKWLPKNERASLTGSPLHNGAPLSPNQSAQQSQNRPKNPDYLRRGSANRDEFTLNQEELDKIHYEMEKAQANSPSLPSSSKTAPNRGYIR